MNRLERQKERDREKVKLICIDCNKEFNLSYGRYRRIKNNQYRCKECMNINRANKNRENYKNLSQEEKNRVNNKRTSYWKDDNNKKKKSENMKQFYQNLNENDKKNWTKGIDGYYRNLSDKEKQLHSQRTKDQWSNYTKEEYDKRCENISIGKNNWWNNLSQEERNEWSETSSQKHKDWWNSLTADQLIEQGLKISQAYHSKSQQEKDAISQKRKKWWNSLSEEEKLNFSNYTRNWWQNLTTDEYIEQCEKISAGMHNMNNYKEFTKRATNNLLKYQQNMTQEEFEKATFNRIMSRNKNCEANDLELEFRNLLNIEKIKYEFQYLNQIEHPDFKKLFPFNPYKLSKVFPLHTWDFFIHTNDKDILVDIDGPIHDPNKTDSTVTDNRNIIFNLKDAILYDDSQRLYQTDNLDAYIIRCYKDNLYDKEVIVEKLQTKEIMNLNQFISIISYMNSNKK